MTKTEIITAVGAIVRHAKAGNNVKKNIEKLADAIGREYSNQRFRGRTDAYFKKNL